MTFRLGRVQVRVSFYFFLAVSLFLLWDQSGVAGLFFLALLFHEAGHLLVIAALGLPVGELELTPLSVGLKLAPEARVTPGRELAVTLAGCGMNLLAAFLLLVFPGEGALLRLSAVNLALGAFHLLPVSGLDGGTALTLLCTGLLGWQRGRTAAAWLLRGLGALAMLGLCWRMASTGPSLPMVLLLLLFSAGIFAPDVESMG